MPDEIVVKAEIQHEHTEETGNFHSCEFDPENVKAQSKHGILQIYAPISEGIARKIDVSAA